MYCIHAIETPEGCGHAPFCSDCVVRNSVREAYSGKAVVRKKTHVELESGGLVNRIYLLITASPFSYESEQLVLLVLEDMSETIALRGLLPICAKCKKIRNDKSYWQKLETYFKEQMDMDFSHGLCPECTEEFMAQIVKSGKESTKH
jgi:hypothetical protein